MKCFTEIEWARKTECKWESGNYKVQLRCFVRETRVLFSDLICTLSLGPLSILLQTWQSAKRARHGAGGRHPRWWSYRLQVQSCADNKASVYNFLLALSGRLEIVKCRQTNRIEPNRTGRFIPVSVRTRPVPRFEQSSRWPVECAIARVHCYVSMRKDRPRAIVWRTEFGQTRVFKGWILFGKSGNSSDFV